MHRAAVARLGVEEACASAISGETMRQRLTWRPTGIITMDPPGQVRRCGADEDEYAGSNFRAAITAAPSSYEGSGDYVFISYRHRDVDRVVPVLHLMGDWQLRFWFDKGIPGGAEWDAVIEERLENCRLLVLFVSQSAVQSKYVRREAKFADMINKPLVSIQLEDVHLSEGMGMLLTQYQMIDARAADFPTRLMTAIARHNVTLGRTNEK
jgi:hypothetical protein